jgi:hypothetical protein
MLQRFSHKCKWYVFGEDMSKPVICRYRLKQKNQFLKNNLNLLKQRKHFNKFVSNLQFQNSNDKSHALFPLYVNNLGRNIRSA